MSKNCLDNYGTLKKKNTNKQTNKKTWYKGTFLLVIFTN